MKSSLLTIIVLTLTLVSCSHQMDSKTTTSFLPEVNREVAQVNRESEEDDKNHDGRVESYSVHEIDKKFSSCSYAAAEHKARKKAINRGFSHSDCEVKEKWVDAFIATVTPNRCHVVLECEK
jgi:hypothetical protein